jgi:hypothetical protein
MSFRGSINNQFYVGLVMQLKDYLFRIPERVTEEELRLSSKEHL